MERFNLDTWLENKSRQVIDDDGFPVEIIHWNAHVKYPVVYLDHNGVAVNVSTDGMYDSDPNHGLFFADEELTEFEKAVEKTIPYKIPIDMLKSTSQQLLELARKEIEKSSWSEEDEKMWSQVINEIEAIKSNSSTIFEKNIAQDKIDWLNSIKDRVQPQPKQEWSEEDNIHLKNAIFAAEKEWGLESVTAKWLKSLKDRFQLHPEETEYISKEEHEKILEQVYKEHDEDLEQAYKNADKVQFNRGMDEVLTNPKKYFHIGDTIRLKNSTAEYTIVSIFNGRYYGDGWSLGIQEAADHYELVKEQDCNLENTIDLLEAIAEDQEKDYCPYNAAKLRKTSSWLKSIKKKQQWTPEDKSMYLRVLGILGKCYMKVLPDKVKEELEWMKGLDKRIELNPKQELTEEDKEVLNTIISDVTRTYRSCGIGTDEYNIRTKALDFLKSIKDKPKQEWTEKDMVMITSIISDSEQGALLDPEQINWLKQKFNKQ